MIWDAIVGGKEPDVLFSQMHIYIKDYLIISLILIQLRMIERRRKWFNGKSFENWFTGN